MKQILLQRTTVPPNVLNRWRGALSIQPNRRGIVAQGPKPSRALLAPAGAKRKDDDIADVEVVFDGVEDGDDRAGLGFLEGNSAGAIFSSVGVVTDQIAEIIMPFVPEGTSFEIVRIAVIGGSALIILSFVKGLLSLVLTIGTVGFGAYVYTNVYGGGSGSGSGSGRQTGRTASRAGGRRGATKKRKPAADGSSSGNILTSLINNSADAWSGKTDDGLLDVTFKKPNTNQSNTSKRK
jgi:hypothetical protein